MLNYVRKLRDDWMLPPRAKAARRRDAQGLPAAEPAPEQFVDAAVAWLGRAQDCSASADGGVARDYSLIDGWASSYPETTGYIIPTMIDHGRRTGDDDALQRARAMLQWLADIQFDSGAFQGGRIDSEPVVPVTFNTGQILLGLAHGLRHFGDFEVPTRKAADWLVATQDDDGCWRRFATPFAAPGEKTYETHVAWGLFEAERVLPGRGYAEAGLKQVDWALGWQRDNGWFERCCLSDPQHPLTHTLGYVLRGVLEAHRLSAEQRYLDAARRTGDALLGTVGADGHLPGRLGSDWRPHVQWACLTGSVQIAHCLLLLYQTTANEAYLQCALRLNRFVRRTVVLNGEPDIRGAVKGSFPVGGDYGAYEYLNWAAKFAIDANVLELEIRRPEQPAGAHAAQVPASSSSAPGN